MTTLRFLICTASALTALFVWFALYPSVLNRRRQIHPPALALLLGVTAIPVAVIWTLQGHAHAATLFALGLQGVALTWVLSATRISR